MFYPDDLDEMTELRYDISMLQDRVEELEKILALVIQSKFDLGEHQPMHDDILAKLWFFHYQTNPLGRN